MQRKQVQRTHTEQRKPQRPRGSGSVFTPKQSRFLSIKYYYNGRPIVESTRRTSKSYAEKLLRDRLAAIHLGMFLTPEKRRVSVEQLYNAMLEDYRRNHPKSVNGATQRWRDRLSKHFGRMLAANLNSDYLNAYISYCEKLGLSNATINRDLSCLKHSFMLALKRKDVSSVPDIPHLTESAPRKGFIEDRDYELLWSQAPSLVMRTLLCLGYTFGMRKSELLGLRVGQVDLIHRLIRLEETKNYEPRIAPLTQEACELVRECCHGKKRDDLLLTRPKGGRVVDFRDSWASMCCAAGGLGKRVCPTCRTEVLKHRCPKCRRVWRREDLRFEGKLFHDLRRTAVRNMVRAGVPEKVAMLISGHKTRSVFERYNIVNERDLIEAVRKLERSREETKKAAAEENGQRSGIQGPSESTSPRRKVN